MSSATTPTTPTTPTAAVRTRWFPLESNPVLLNRYVSRLGVDTARYSFVDVFSTDEWALAMIPPGTVAVLMLYPLSPVQEAHRHAEEEEARSSAGADRVSDRVWHTHQRIGNACGTVGILHALANLPPAASSAALLPGGWTDRFLTACPASRSASDKADLLEGTSALAKELESSHDAAASDATNQTARGGRDDEVLTHFVALVHVDGGLYELDGRKSAPVRHGDTTEDALLRDACGVVKTFMARDPGELRFTILALAPTVEP